MISTYPVEMIKRLEDRIKELEFENKELRDKLSDLRWDYDDLQDRCGLGNRENW